MTGWYDWNQVGSSGAGALAVTALLLLIVIIGGLALLARADERYSDASLLRRSAEELLDERLARGEITPEQYRQRRAALRGAGPRPSWKV